MGEVTIYDEGNRSLTAADVRSHVNLIQQVMEGVMKEGTHYGTIPGTSKPALYKAGTEVLLTTFRIAVEPDVDDLSDEDQIRYRVRAVGRHQTSGIIVGVGIGECSSNEEKYKWREAVCDAEFDDTDETRRRTKYQKKWNNRDRQHDVRQIKQVRTEPADIANTVLKMAKKRAQVDLCLTSTAASDIFTQDLEDMPPELRENAKEDEGQDNTIQQPRARQTTKKKTTKKKTGGKAEQTANEQAPDDGESPPATEKQQNMIKARLVNANIPDRAFEEQFGPIAQLPFKRVNEALEWIHNFEQGDGSAAY